MTYDATILARAQQRFESDRRRRADEFARRCEEVYARQPRLRQVERYLGGTMSRIISTALRQGTDPAAAIAQLKEENLSLQAERKRMLAELELPADYLEEKPACRHCGDTGYRGEAMCRCLRAYYAKEQQKELSRMLDLGSQCFDNFSLEWYSDRVDPRIGISPRENMERTRDICADYACDFNNHSGNLLLTGQTGLGKTFLSACIAREVSEKGCSVVYDTAAHIFERFETRKFSRDDEQAEADTDRILACDLLILDDLGTEMTTTFVQSALYQIVNTRMMEHKSTIISTNLSVREIGQRYSAALESRIEGEYQVLPFFGEDIRLLKRDQGM